MTQTHTQKINLKTQDEMKVKVNIHNHADDTVDAKYEKQNKVILSCIPFGGNDLI